MIRTTAPWALALLVALAANAFAAEGQEDRASGTVSLWGSDAWGGGVGARFQVDVPLGHGQHWTISPGLGYGYGYGKTDVSGPSSTYKSSHSDWDALLDFLYSSGDNVRLYCGPGLFYTLTSFTQSLTGMPDVGFKPWTAGAQLTLGGGVRVSTTSQLTGRMTQRAGFTTYDRSAGGFDSKFVGISHSTQFSVGLRVRF